MAISCSYKRTVVRAISFALICALASVSTAIPVSAIEKGPSSASAAPFDWRQSVIELRGKRLAVPIDGYNTEQMRGAFYQGRVGHTHHAADLLAPRNTPIRAVENGTIGRLFESAAGGLTIYQKDPSGRFVYYYAHLENYAEGLKEGDSVARGQVIGYVGTSGNAPPNTPHLHFAISVIAPGSSVFKGQPVDPFEVYSRDASVVSNGPPAEKTASAGPLPSIAAQFPSRSSTSNNDRGGVFRTENRVIQIKPQTQSDREPLPKRQTTAPNQNDMPPVAPNFKRSASTSSRTHAAKPPPQPIPITNKLKTSVSASQSKRQASQSKQEHRQSKIPKESQKNLLKSGNPKAGYSKPAGPKKQVKKESPKSRMETSHLPKTGVAKRYSKSAVHAGSARLPKTVAKPVPKSSPTHQSSTKFQRSAKHPVSTTVKAKKVGKTASSIGAVKPKPKVANRKTVGSKTPKKVIAPTRKSSKSSSSAKSSKPQKPSVVLRKQNKIPTPKKRSVH